MATSPALRVTGVLRPNPEAHEVKAGLRPGQVARLAQGQLALVIS